jgi:hypothetical protein
MKYNQSIQSVIIEFNKSCISAIEKIDLKILIFVVLCLNFLSFHLTDNEETQLSLAKQFMDSGWMPNSFLFNEWPGNRLLYQIISGFFLRHVEFESLIFFGRLSIFLLISIPVGAIFKKLEIRNLYAIIAFQIYLIHQNFFGGEFIFADFEVKCIAYIFVMAGLYYLLINKYLWAVFFAVIASYFHILAGGWFFCLIFLYSIFTGKSFGLILKGLLLYILLMMPFIFYLGNEIFRSGSVINGVNIDWVYAYFRNPHHTAPLSVKENLTRTIFQICVSAIIFLVTVFVFRKFKGEFLNKLFALNVIIFSMLFISLGISLIDKNGVLLKFYLFRIAALGCFIMYLYVFLLLKSVPRIPPFIQSSFFIIGFYLIIAAAANTCQQIFFFDPKPEYQELVSYVKLNTHPEDIFLNLGDYELSFSRKTRRDEFVVYKFVPFGGKKVYEWYIRILNRQNIANYISKIRDLKQKYRLDYLLSDHSVDDGNNVKLVFRNKAYYLYKIQ